MAKHVLDRRRPRRSDKVTRFTSLDRRIAMGDVPGPVMRTLIRRAKGPVNGALIMRAFLRIRSGRVA